MAKKGIYLHTLVHSLTKSEQRKVRLFARMKGGQRDGQLMLLFDRLRTQPAYDETDLEKVFSSGVTEKRISALKTRLFDLTLEALIHLAAQSNLDFRLNRLLESIQLLQQRKQWDEAEKLIRKTRIIAEQYEQPRVVLRLLDLQLHQLPAGYPSPEAFFTKLKAEQAHFQALETEHQQLRTLQAEARAYARAHTRNRTGSSLEPFHALMQNPILQSVQQPQSLLSRAWLTDIQGIYHLVTGNYAQAAQLYAQLIDEWKAAPLLIKQEGELFLGIYSNFLTSSLFSGEEKKKFNEALDYFQQFTGFSPALKFRFDLITYSQKMLSVLHAGSLEQGNQFIQTLDGWIQNHREQISAERYLSFCYNISIFYFLYGKNQRSYHWLIKILNCPGRKERAGLRDFARIFQLILQYEFGNVDLNSYLLRSARRYFQRTDKLQAYETAILHFIKNELDYVGPKPAPAHLIQLKTALTEIAADKSGGDPHGLTELMVWIQSKEEQVYIGKLFRQELED